jgi:hypothetical protein
MYLAIEQNQHGRINLKGKLLIAIVFPILCAFIPSVIQDVDHEMKIKLALSYDHITTTMDR